MPVLHSLRANAASALVSIAAPLFSAAALLTVAVPAADAQYRTPRASAMAAKPIASDRFQTAEHILQWISNYRLEPEPKLVPAAVKAMARLGLFREPERAGVYFGFVGGVIADHQTKARDLIAQFFPLPPQDQIGVLRAIAASGLPEWRDLIGHFAERMPARRILVRKYLRGELKSLAETRIEASPEVLDSLWGFYFATGSHQPLIRIVSALELAEDRNNLERLTVGSMAKWTLATNAQREKEILDLLRAELRHQPKIVQKPLKDVILAAETYETGKLRKATLAAIDDLRTKGPEKNRNWTWWGQAAQSAIAIGCIAASAAGLPEVGLPCIIGGALTTAATKLLAPVQPPASPAAR